MPEFIWVQQAKQPDSIIGIYQSKTCFIKQRQFPFLGLLASLEFKRRSSRSLVLYPFSEMTFIMIRENIDQ